MSKLTGKVAVVTGASKGIGAAIALALAAEGAAVAVNYAGGKDGAERVVAEIIKGGGKAVAIQADVGKPADIGRLFAETLKAFGHLDILVNNAGIYEFGSLEQITPEHFHKQFNVNVLGLLLVTQEAVKHFGTQGGNVINISSAVTSLLLPQTSVYTATKAAVDAVTVTLSKELGPSKIRVNAINPGGVDTEGTRSMGMIGGDMEKDMVSKTPLGRIGQPKDIATIAVFLASEDSGWMTGNTLLASGGLQ